MVEEGRHALALLSAARFDHPAKKLVMIGVTGTKGKTTTTHMIRAILLAAGKKVGMIGTTGTVIGDVVTPTLNTTPESYELHQAFAQMVEAGCEYAVMEVSSQGLMLHRTAGIPFELGIFTNIEPDHIGPAEHASFEDYIACKGRLFRQCRVGIMNGDDPHLEEILKGHTCKVETFGLSEGVDLRRKIWSWSEDQGTLAFVIR